MSVVGPNRDRLPVLINAGGGTAKAAGQGLRGRIEQAFASANLTIALEVHDGCDIEARARELAGASTVVVGGGDGTLGCTALALAGSGTALGVLALGTRNHLAGELGVPTDLAAAATLIAERPVRRIDLGRVNDRAFVNNASIGLYPAMVRYREATQERRGLPKKLASIPAALAALRRLRHHRLRLSMPGDERQVATPMLFVGNNRYELKLGELGRRASLDEGVLSVFAVAGRGRGALVGFALRTLIGRADARDFAAIGDTPDLTVSGHGRAVSIALDGELTQLDLPLRFRSDPGALTVIAPPAA